MFKANKARLLIGRAKVTSDVTAPPMCSPMPRCTRGDYDINCGVRYSRGEAAFEKLLHEISKAFTGADFDAATRLMDRHFRRGALLAQIAFPRRAEEDP